MSRVYPTILALSLFSAIIRCEAQTPGKVDQPNLWLASTASGDSVFLLLHSLHLDENVQVVESGLLQEASGAINFRPVPGMALSDARWLIGDSLATLGVSLFMVEKSTDADERTLWSMEVADSGRLVLTTLRTADLTTGMHLMNAPSNSGPIKLIAHHHRAKTCIEGNSYFRLGHAAPIPAVPTPAFEGLVPEMLFYDRFLSPKEHGRISSYLAIKYGITLSNEDYVASDQRRVWPNRANGAFAHNVLGIACDSAAVLDQRQSTSSNEDGFLVLGLDTITRWHHEHPTALPNGHYLITGDDGHARSWAERQQGQPQMSERIWHLQRTGDVLLNTRLRLATGMFLNQAENDRSYWLLIDRSGHGEFGPSNTDVHMATASENNTAEFRDVVWDTDGSGSDRFRFAAGGPFIPLTWVDAPTCEPPTLGSITVRVPGGVAPISCRLEGIGHEATLEAPVSADTATTITGISSGEYELTITDASGYTLTDHLWIEPKDAPEIPLQPRYELVAEEPLTLDASVEGAFVTYEWTVDGSVVGNMSHLLVERPGTYSCTVVSDGCPARKSTEVFTRTPDGGIAIGVMPNPAFNGDFVVQVALPENTDATLTIASLQGTLVRQRALRGQQFYRINEHIGGAGEYIISIKTAAGQRFARVIVL